MGKRQIGELQPFEFAIAVMISDLAAIPLADEDKKLSHALIPIAVLIVCQLLISFLAIRGVRIREIICGKPVLLIRNGKILEKNMRKEMYTINDLLEQLRFNSIQDVNDVEYGILETNGQLSVLLKSNKRAVTPEDLGMDLPPECFNRDIIIDGKLIGRNLERLQLKREWLDNALKKFGINDYKHVFYAYINNKMELFVQKKGEYLE
ncbi:MAG: YetF domain-containing protein [Acetivibrionales bacterium]